MKNRNWKKSKKLKKKYSPIYHFFSSQIDFWLVFSYNITELMTDLDQLVSGAHFSLSVANDVEDTDTNPENNQVDIVVDMEKAAYLYQQG